MFTNWSRGQKNIIKLRNLNQNLNAMFNGAAASKCMDEPIKGDLCIF